MPPTTRRVYKIDDATLVSVFSSLADLFPGKSSSSTFVLAQGITMLPEDLAGAEGLGGRFAFETATLNIAIQHESSLNVFFRRSTKHQNGNTEPSARYDEFDVNFGGRDPSFWNENKDLVGEVLKLVSCDSEVPETVSDEDSVLSELIRSLNATHRQMLGSLQESLKDSIDRRAELEREAEKKDTARAEKHAEEIAKLEAEREKLQLQSYRSERRKIMQQLTNDKALKQRREMTPPGLIKVRWAVFVSSIVLGLISFYITYLSLSQIAPEESMALSISSSLPEQADGSLVAQVVQQALGTTNWYLIIRSVFSSLVGIGAFAYAANWLRTFYDSEVAATRAVDQFNHDLVRASWVIETVLEVKQEHDSVVPNHWIEGVTRGLFADNGAQSQADEGIQALKALLGFSAGASFGPDGPKVELNRKGAKKLSED
ncbi:hypothetical protein [Cognatishimia activa]|uniref:Uncharacterized protein n=1 Tax=Cognatishimia activa TaxID=1715691 RepID=A0A975EM57_9RHOB|nr:hypothetical protein [Cognatishimia activa]QTN34673.1 hypothetical protein HZ995_09130 [Cognatishimia activa]